MPTPNDLFFRLNGRVRVCQIYIYIYIYIYMCVVACAYFTGTLGHGHTAVTDGSSIESKVVHAQFFRRVDCDVTHNV